MMKKERLFKHPQQARDIFLRYSASVTEANYINTAIEFLQNDDEFEKAVERVRATFTRKSETNTAI